jgi:tetratricopeptide (TPR) repeat protein
MTSVNSCVQKRDAIHTYNNQIVHSKKLDSIGVMKQNLSDSISFVSKNISFFLLTLSLIGILIGKVYFDISFLQPLEKIAIDQQEYRRKSKQEQLKVIIAQRHIDLGNRLIEINNLQAAKEEFKSALSFDQHNNEAEFGLFKSQIFDNFDTFGHPIETIRKKIDLIIEHNSNDAHAFYFLGMLYRKADAEFSITNFNKAIILNKNFPDAYFQLGGLILANSPNDFTKSLRYYETALELSEHNARYLNNVANLLYINSRFDEAVPFYEILIKLNNNYLLPYLTFSNILFINQVERI